MKSGEIRRSGRGGSASATGKRCLHELLHVFHADATFGAGPLHQPNLHAELARQSAHRWSCWRRRALRRRFRRRRLRRARTPADLDDLSSLLCSDGPDGSDRCRSLGRIRNLHGRTLDFPLPSLRCAALRAALVFGLIARRGLRIRGRLLTQSAGCCRGLGRPRRLRLLVARLRRVCLLGGRAVGNGEHDLPDLHFLARFDAHFTDGTGDARRHFDGGLVGLELEDRLIFSMVSPGLTSTRTTSPAAMFSPSSGSLNSVGISGCDLAVRMYRNVGPGLQARPHGV